MCNVDCVEPCQLLSCRGLLWICYTCHQKLRSGQEHSANRITLKVTFGFVLRRTRTQFAVVRYMRISLDVEDEEEVGRRKEAHYMSLLQLFHPYRSDVELKPAGFESYALFYEQGIMLFSDASARSVKSVVDANRAKFEVDKPQLDKAQDLTCILSDNNARGDLSPKHRERREQEQDEIAEECFGFQGFKTFPIWASANRQPNSKRAESPCCELRVWLWSGLFMRLSWPFFTGSGTGACTK